MIDLYALPKDFPGRSAQPRNPADPTPYVETLERAFGDDVGDRRFVPYIQLHEFEALLFADGDDEKIVTVHGGGILVSACDGERLVTGGDDARLVSTNAAGVAAEIATDDKKR